MGAPIRSLNKASFNPPANPGKWVVDCKCVGSGEKALIYLGRYLYRGVLPEKDIVACEKGQVTFRYKESKTGRLVYKTLPGAEFLWRLLRHVLPKGFRRARNFGFLHPNSKRLIQVLQLCFNIDPNPFRTLKKERAALSCPCCGATMRFTRFRIPPAELRKPCPPYRTGGCIA